MALREDQIVKFGRQILLRDVGGRGQERLLASPVRVIGSGPAIDDAVAWLVSGGTPVELVGPPSKGFLAGVRLEPLTAAPVAEVVLRGEESRAALKTLVVIGRGVAFRAGSACEQCWSELSSALESGPPAPAGALAALTVQRLALGWSEPLGLVRWTGARFESAPPPKCSHG